MEISGIGVDLVDVDRVRVIMSRRATFAERVFTPEEIAYCDRQANPAEAYAARWAAREACRKSLGGVRGMRWHDVRVDRAPSGAPSLVLGGSVQRRAAELGVSQVMVALTHERRMAGAFCVAVRA
ncbi:MAG TPA: holo-ACP synthase [Acidimicrobiia bacterium]|nr:holo-ACP synthase [Acidimicrobiia bacterium]